MKRIIAPRLRGQLRHLLTAIGTVLAAHGATSVSDWELYVGLAMAILSFVDSWRSPEKKQ